MIYQIFNHEEAEIICSIPINLFEAKDKLSWWPISNDLFSVKSTYALEMSQIQRTQGEPLDLRAREQHWKGMWKLNIPGGAKHFIWKACYDILPIRLNLAKRKVSNQVNFPICNLEPVTITHTLWECPATSDVLDEEASPLWKWKAAAPNFMDLWTAIAAKTSTKTQELCALVCRKLWLRRNSFIFANAFTNPYRFLSWQHSNLKHSNLPQPLKWIQTSGKQTTRDKKRGARLNQRRTKSSLIWMQLLITQITPLDWVA